MTKITLTFALLMSLVLTSEANEVSLRLLTVDGLPTTRGEASYFQIMMANHSSQDQTVTCYTAAPESWETLPSSEIHLAPHTAQIVPLAIKVPADASQGTHRIAVGIADADSQALISCDQFLVLVP